MLAHRWIHGPTLTRCFRFQFSKYATAAVGRSQKPGATGLAQLEDEGARVLRIVKKRIDERAKLLSEVRSITYDISYSYLLLCLDVRRNVES